MPGENEIQFLLDFEFENSGAKELENYLTRFIAYFGNFNDVIALSGPEIQKVAERLNELSPVIKKVSVEMAEQTGVTKESQLAMRMIYEEGVRYKQQMESLVSIKTRLTKTTEELTGQLNKATSNVKALSGSLLEMEQKGKANTKQYTDLSNQLTEWKNILINLRVEIDKSNVKQTEYNGILTKTKERISELTLVLDTFTTSEELSSSEAKVYKDELASLNNILNLLRKETSGVLTVEDALNKVRETNIKMANQIIANDEKEVESKAQLIKKEDEYTAKVKNRVSVLKTGFTLEEIAEQERREKQLALIEKAEQEEVQSINRVVEQTEKAEAKKSAAQYQSYQKTRASQIASIEAAERREVAAIQNLVEQTERAEARKVAAQEKEIWTMDNIVQKIDYMGIRMIATGVWWGVVIGGAYKLYEYWTKISDESQIALDRLKSYFEEFNNQKKNSLDEVPTVLSSIYGKQKDFTIERERMLNGATLDDRYNAYKKLQSIAPQVLDDLSKQQFALKEQSEAFRIAAQRGLQYIEVLELLSVNQRSRDSHQKLLLENEEQTHLLIRRIMVDDPSYKNENEVLNRASYVSSEHGLEAEKSPVYKLVELSKLLKQKQPLIDDLNQDDKEVFKLTNKRDSMEGATKNAKGRNTKVNHDLEEERSLEKSSFEGKLLSIADTYDLSGRSDSDKVFKYSQMQDAAQAHLDKMEEINKKYEDTTKDSKVKLKKYREDDLNDYKRVIKEISSEGHRDLMESQKYNEERIKQIEKTNKDISIIIENGRKNIEEVTNMSLETNRRVKRASRFNSFQAFFGGGSENITQNRKDENQRLSEIESSKRLDYSRSESKYYRSFTKAQSTQSQVDSDSTVKDSTELQKEQFKFNLSENEKAQQELIESQKDYYKKSEELTISSSTKKLKLLTDKKQDEVKIAETTFTLAQTFADRTFEYQAKKIKMQMDNIKGMYDFEMTLAGNNSAAKIRIATAEHGQLLSLRREEAKNAKNQAEFSAAINAATAVTQVLASLPPPASIILAGVIGGMALDQEMKIQSETLPSYYIGRKGGKKELANINEKGLEIIENESGEKKVFNHGKPTIALLEEGDTVYTHEKSKNILSESFNKGISELSKYDKNTIIVNGSNLNKQDLESAMFNAVSRIPPVIFKFPAKGVEQRLQRSQQRNGA